MYKSFYAEGALPFPLSRAASVQDEDSYLLVGGSNIETGEYVSTVMRFDPLEETFVIMPNVRLQVARGFATAMLVDALAFHECPEN